MSQRFPFVGAVYAFIIEAEQVLLARRINTGYCDGEYGVPAGHLDGGESVYAGLCRELAEEVGIVVDPSDLTVVHVMQRRLRDGHERFDVFLRVLRYQGTVTNTEPHKCDEVRFFPLTALPQNMIPYVQTALQLSLRGEYFSVEGYHEPRT